MSIETLVDGVTLGLAWTPNLPLQDGAIGLYGKLMRKLPRHEIQI